jgi:hypothetical protein
MHGRIPTNQILHQDCDFYHHQCCLSSLQTIPLLWHTDVGPKALDPPTDHKEKIVMMTHKMKNIVLKRPLQSKPQTHHQGKQKEPNQQLPLHENSMLPELSMVEPLDLDDILITLPVH